MNNRLLLLVILSALVFFANLGGTSIYILDEARNAGCAMEMWQRHDPIIPTFNDVLRTDKPPLHYFFMMLAYTIGGVTPFTARLFSALAGVMLVVFVYRKVRTALNEPVAFYTGLVLLSSLQLAIQFHLAVPDPYLILWMAVSLLSFYTGFEGNRRADMRWFYVAAALAFLTKGLIAIVFPGIIISFYLLLTQRVNLTSFRKLRLLWGIMLFLIIALPWYLAVGYQTDGAWLRGFFIEHNLDRYTRTMEGHRGFPLAPFAILLLALLPFSVFIIQAVRLALRQRKEHPFLLYCLIVVVTIAGFFSFSKTILPSYPAPVIPFLAVVLGYYLHALVEGRHTHGALASFIAHGLLCLAIPIGVYIALGQEKPLAPLQWTAWLFVALPVGCLTGMLLYFRGRRAGLIYVWSGAWMLATLLFFYVAFPAVDQKNPVTESLPILTSYPDHEFVAYRRFNPAFVFALGRTLPMIDSPQQVENLLKKKIIIFSRTQYLDDFKDYPSLKVIYRGRDLFERGETVLLAN